MPTPMEFLNSLPEKQNTPSKPMEFLSALPPKKEMEEASVLKTFFSGTKEGIKTDTSVSDVATLIKATDSGSKLFNVPKEYGVSETAWADMSQAERRVFISEYDKKKVRETIDPSVDTESFTYKAGRFAGSLVDPTTLIPLGGASKMAKAANLLKLGEKAAATRMAAKGLSVMATTGAAVGMTDAALYSAAKMGEVDPGIVGVGAVAGAVLPVATYGIAKGASNVISKGQSKKEANAILKALNETKAAYRAEGMSDTIALAKAVETLQLNEESLAKVLKKTGKQVETFRTKASAKEYGNIAMQGTGHAPKTKFGKGVSAAFTPMDSKLKEVAPYIYGKVQEVEREGKALLHKYDTMVKGHIGDLKKLKKQGILHKYWTMALSEGNEEEMRIYLKTHLGDNAAKNYDSYLEVTKDMLAKENSVRGSKNQIKGITGYYPRYAKDPEALRKAIGEKYGKEAMSALDLKLKKIGKGKKVVTEHERGKAIADFVTDLYTKPAKVIPGYSKKRLMRDIDEDMLDLYSPLEQSIHTRIRRGVDEYTMRKVLGKEIAEKYGDSIENGTIDWLDGLAKKKLIMPEDVDYIHDLLKSRYINGLKGTSRAIQVYKALQHGTLLPQLPSVITQYEDLARTAWRFGVADTAKAFFAKSNKYIDPKLQGFIDNLQEEYIHQGVLKNIVNKEFKYSGFQGVDLAGKAAHQNASLLNYGKKAITSKGAAEISNKYLPILGGKRAAKVIEDFKSFHKAKLKGERGIVTEDMRNIAWMELADIQPITQWGMPKAYADHPNLRFMYTLRSFTVKQLDNYRTNVFQAISKGDYSTAFASATKLIGFMTAAGMTKDQIVNWMTGKEESVEDSMWKNILRATGIFDKHTLSQMGRGDPVEEFAKGILPPTGVIGTAAESVRTVGTDIFTDEEVEYDEDYMRYVPFIGRLISSYRKAEEDSANW